MPSSDQRSAFQQWYLVVVLALTYIVNYIDRGAINLMVEPIKHDLNLTDIEMSVLIGFAFVSLYSIGIVPAGYIADRINRRLMLAGAVVFWSGAAVMSGFAGNYTQLFVARAALGLGESTLPPTAYSLLRDGVAEKNRGRAFSIYNSALMLGNGSGALIGGAVFALATAGAFSALPFIGDLRPWQYVIVIPGLCGAFIVLLLLSARDPPRSRAPVKSDPVSFAELFRHMRRNAGIYAVIFTATIAVSLGFAGWNVWIAAAIGRTWGLSPSTIGKTIGTLGLIVFPLSVFLVGYLMDFIKRKWNNPAAPFWVAIGGCLLNLGPAMLVLHAPTIKLMWISYGCYIFCTTAGVQIACGYMLATFTPSRLMGKATSCYYLTNNLVAGATSPTIMAAVAHFAFDGPRALANAMSLCYAVFISITIAVLIIGIRNVGRWHARHAATVESSTA
ncbi:MAG: MFS transporter [Pseudomonadota bacterium]